MGNIKEKLENLKKEINKNQVSLCLLEVLVNQAMTLKRSATNTLDLMYEKKSIDQINIEILKKEINILNDFIKKVGEFISSEKSVSNYGYKGYSEKKNIKNNVVPIIDRILSKYY